MTPTEAAVARVARDTYGRLLAYLVARTQDILTAEDALADAFLRALSTWPKSGVPENPEAWLMTSAKRLVIDHMRRTRTQDRYSEELLALMEESACTLTTGEEFPDERLKLLFVCAHPAIDAGTRTPLMLQAVLGLDAKRIASAFIVAPSTMSQRLVRAKRKILQANIPFELPDKAELPSRLHCVLETIYAAFTASDGDTGAWTQSGLREEAIWLARILTSHLPEQPSCRSLLALLLLVSSRNPLNPESTGRYIPIAQQDPRHWDTALIEEANQLLQSVGSAGSSNHFHLEACIQAVHAARLHTGTTDWPSIIQLYELLLQHSPTIGALVSYAAALSESGREQDAASVIATLSAQEIKLYQPYWAVLARIRALQGQSPEAIAAYEKAIALSSDAYVQEFLRQELSRLQP